MTPPLCIHFQVMLRCDSILPESITGKVVNLLICGCHVVKCLGCSFFCWVHSIEVSHDSEKWFHFLDAYLSYYNRPLVERKCYKLSFLFQQRSAGFVSKNLNLAMNEFSHIFLVLNFRRLRHEALHFGDEKSHESLQSELTRTRNGPFLEELQLVQQRSSVVVFFGGPNSRPVGREVTAPMLVVSLVRESRNPKMALKHSGGQDLFHKLPRLKKPIIWGDQTWCQSRVVLKDFPSGSALLFWVGDTMTLVQNMQWCMFLLFQKNENEKPFEEIYLTRCCWKKSCTTWNVW